MRASKLWFPAGLAMLAWLVGCGGDDEASGSSNGSPRSPIDLVVDANRDGVANADDPADQDGENDFTAQSGASFLANLDDDDSNGVADVDDEVINGESDEADLAPMEIAAWPDAPDGATGALTVDALSAENVRIWKKQLDGAWALIAGSKGPCDSPMAACEFVTAATFSSEEVRAGLTLGIEGRHFRTSNEPGAWTGDVDLAYSVADSSGNVITTDDLPDGIDHVKMRVAPWLMVGNHMPSDHAWSDSYDPNFTSQLSIPLDKAAITYTKITDYYDQWVQDYFQTGWTSIPGPNETVRGMRVFNARPWSQDGVGLPINWLKKNMFGPDQAVIEIYKVRNSGDTYDSHGNHDLLPPYENGAESYPHGRLFLGSGILPETTDFYEAQRIQGSAVRVDTSWLIVGHIDEVFSYVPAATPRGWKLLVGSPRLARQMLEQASASGFGGVQMFIGKQWWTGQDASISIDQVLANANIMGWSQQAQAEIDTMLDIAKTAAGLADDEIIEIPFLFEEDSGQGLVAYMPGTVNLLSFGDYVVHADPFGPNIMGNDMFKKDLQDRLGTPVNQLGSNGQGLFVYFADDWDLYHTLLGEVHCASNVSAPPLPNEKWWESGR